MSTETTKSTPSTTTPTTPPAGKTGAFGIGVSDLKKSADFYARVMGMAVQQTLSLPHMDEVVLGYENSRTASIVLMHWTDGSVRNYRDNPVKIVLFVPDAKAVLERIRAEGLPIVREFGPSLGMSGSMLGFGTDPDGYLLEIIQSKPRPAA